MKANRFKSCNYLKNRVRMEQSKKNTFFGLIFSIFVLQSERGLQWKYIRRIKT